MASESKFNYRQTIIGDCGHVCDAWPQIDQLVTGKSFVICDDCTRQQFDIPESERLFVWVRVKPLKKPTAPQKRLPPKPKKVNPFLAMLGQESLFENGE